MTYKILYHHKVREEDLRVIEPSFRKRIFKVIESRLINSPDQYGKPLRRPLAGYWKLRVGKFRIVYKIVTNEVWVLAILHRDKVYDFVVKRGF